MAKLSNKQFWAILTANGGLFTRTVRAIKREMGIDISRQAIENRAKKNPNRLAQIEEENLDIAEESLHEIMRKGIDRNRLKAIELYLKAKGKRRGYFDKLALANDEDKPLFAPVEIFISKSKPNELEK